MAIRTKGSLAGFTIRPETTYGTMPAVATSDWYGGTLESLDDNSAHTMIEDPGDGVMVYRDAFSSMHEAGFSATFSVVKGTPWNNWIDLVLGDTTGFKSEVKSFSAEFSVDTSEHLLFKGCKIESLEISAPLGEIVKFKVDVLARELTIGTVRGIPKLEKPAGLPVMKTARLKYGAVETRDKTCVLSINRGLQREAGVNTAGTIVLASGLDSVPTVAGASLSFTELSYSDAWDKIKLSGGTDKTFTFVLDGKTITCSKCYFNTDDMPSRSQTPYDETISLTVGNVTAV